MDQRPKKYSQTSIRAIIEHAADDRISSKKTVKSLEFGGGAPSTVKQAQLWMQRFTAVVTFLSLFV
jgi:coproporphyrinogen III oxidase-like Fe-S oxidoreductase